MPVDINIGTLVIPAYCVDWIMQALSSGLMVFIAAWAAVKFAFRRHIKEKSYERKSEVLYRINGAIYEMIEGYRRYSMEQSGVKISDEYRDEGDHLTKSGRSYLRTAQGLSGLLLSENISKIINTCITDMDSSYEDNHMVIGDEFVSILKKYHKQFKSQAKKELMLES